MCPSLCISLDFCFKILCNSFSTLQVSPTCCSKDFHSSIPSYAKSYLLLLNLNLPLATLFDVPSSYSGRDNEHRHKSLTKAHLRWTQSLLWVCRSRICRAVAFKGKRGPSWPQELKAEIKRGQIKVFNTQTAEEIFISSYPSNGSCRKGLAHSCQDRSSSRRRGLCMRSLGHLATHHCQPAGKEEGAGLVTSTRTPAWLPSSFSSLQGWDYLTRTR